MLGSKDADGKMRGKPNRAEQQDHAEKELRANGERTLEGRDKRSDVKGGANQDDHGAQSQSDNEDGSENEKKNEFHSAGAKGCREERITQQEEGGKLSERT